MVCKENVVSWFGNLSSYKRIDVMCTLLNMCLPFEIRFLGTCVEDIGKRDYTELRESEHHANNASDLAELATLSVGDKRTRRKLVLYMALLKSCNYSCAVVLHKILANLDGQEIVNITSGSTFAPDDQPMEELLLLYTMALNHPAFTYEQKSTFGNIYLKLQEEESRLNLPKPVVNSSYKSSQGCGPCGNPSDRPVSADSSVEVPVNCSMPPPPIQTYHGDMGIRGNPMVSGVPPGLSLPPPGLCLPSHEQMTMGTTPTGQYLHLGFPAVNHMTPWTGQVMMGNPLMYHTSDILAYPPSPLVSRQSSPSHSRSPSRSNSPLGRRNNTMPRTSSQVVQSTCNTLTTSTSSSNSQSSITSTSATTHHQQQQQQQPTSSIGCTNRSLPGVQPPMLPPRSVPPPITSSNTVYSRHNSIDNTSAIVAATTTKQPLPPPRLRASTSGDSHRDNTAKDVTNFKGNLPNTSFGEIRRMSDEDLRDMGMSQNALGQLRNIVRSQTTNGLCQLGMDKKLENTNNVAHPVGELNENEEQQVQQSQQQQTLQQQQQQQPLQQHHPHSHVNSANMRRYPGISPLEPSQMQIYPPPPMYPQNAHCYDCISVPVANLPTRYSRCNAQHLYCTTQLQALRLDPENSRHCSQSSSSESTGSRSPPETPPAIPWVSSSSDTVSSLSSSTTEHQASTGTSSHHSTMSQTHQGAQSMTHMSERPRNQSKKNQSHLMRQKNQMVNGVTSGGNGNNNGGNNPGNNGGPPNIPHCVSFPGPPTSPQVAFLPHAHFPALRPSTGIYSNFSHAAFSRPPTYQTTYQPNGEMMYQYPGPGGTPPPPPTVAPPPQTYMPSAPVVTYTPAVPPAKISCYNCGSCSHLAADCKDQTMEELTKRATYRMDFTSMKQSGECPSSDK